VGPNWKKGNVHRARILKGGKDVARPADRPVGTIKRGVVALEEKLKG